MRTWLGVSAAGLLAGGPAAAFYFPGWPADGLPRAPTLLGPSVRLWTPPGQPGGDRPPPPIDRPPTDIPPGEWVDKPPAPQVVPEPATIALAALGLGAIAVRRSWATRQPG
jgi:hypothetical protein